MAVSRGEGGVPGPAGCVPGLGGVYLVRGGGHTWSGGVPGLGAVPGPGGCTWSWGVPGPRGVYPRGRGCTWSGGVYLVPGGYLVRYSPPVDRHTLVKT